MADNRGAEEWADRAATLDARIEAGRHLLDLDFDAALAAILKVAEDDEEDAAVREVAGRLLAELVLRHDRLDDFFMGNLHDDAWDAYDQAIGAEQRRRGQK